MNPNYFIPADLSLHPDHLPIPDPVEAPLTLTNSKAFKTWFQQSKVTTATGAPLMVFHGTAREDRRFKASRHHDLEGAYFTDSFKEAKAHAHMDSEMDCEQPYVIAAFIRLNNPLVVYGDESDAISTAQAKAWIAAGYDGVISVSESGVVGEYVVFDPSQIAPFHDGMIVIPRNPLVRQQTIAIEDNSPAP